MAAKNLRMWQKPEETFASLATYPAARPKAT